MTAVQTVHRENRPARQPCAPPGVETRRRRGNGGPTAYEPQNGAEAPGVYGPKQGPRQPYDQPPGQGQPSESAEDYHMPWTEARHHPATIPPPWKPIDWEALHTAQQVIREQVCERRGHYVDPQPSAGSTGHLHWHCIRCGIEFVPSRAATTRL